MEEEKLNQLTAFNCLFYEIDEIYHNYAKLHGLSDAAFLVLYSLWERGKPYPQRELCEVCSCPPQTINTAIKAFEKQSIVELTFSPGNRKSKEVCLTSAGYALAQTVVEPFIQAERNSFFRLSEQERKIILRTLQKHIALFKTEVERILPISENCIAASEDSTP